MEKEKNYVRKARIPIPYRGESMSKHELFDAGVEFKIGL